MSNSRLFLKTIIFLSLYASISLSQDTTLTVTPEGNIGIGVGIPSAKLHIRSGGGFPMPQMLLEQTGPGDNFSRLRFINPAGHVWDIAESPANQLRFFTGTNSLDVMTLNTSGNIGIGTYSASEKLVVGSDLGEALSGNRITIGNTTGPAALNIGTDINNRAFLFWDHVNKHLSIGTRIDEGQFGQTLILKDGRIGMGLATPEEKLQVNGIVYSMNGGFKFPDGTVQTTAAATNGLAFGTLDDAYDYGGPGAGRIITADAGAFEVGGTDGVVLKGTFNNGTIPATGAGPRLMWYPAKAAFRAGGLFGDGSNSWDDDSIAVYSVATGYNTVASGDVSTALGHTTHASGGFSFATGVASQASGAYSTAMGYTTEASGNYSTAVGRLTEASGLSSTAMGYNTVASGNYSSAMGNYVSTSGQGALIIGDNSTTGPLNSSADNRFSARFANGYFLYTNSATTIGAALTANSNSWAVISDSTKKENFQAINGEKVLNKISQFKLGSWNYKGQDKTQFRHYGPMAQDFYNAFGNDGIGTIGNDTTISSADFDGINFIAIQALEKRTAQNEKLRVQSGEQAKAMIEKLSNELDDLRSENESLKQKLEILFSEYQNKIKKDAHANAEEM